jgi:hypothetical protein
VKRETGEKLIERFLDENLKCKILIYWISGFFKRGLEKMYLGHDSRGTLLGNSVKLYFSEVKIFK